MKLVLVLGFLFGGFSAHSAEIKCGPILSQLDIWSHGGDSASVKNEYRSEPTYDRLFQVTSLGGGFDNSVGRPRFSKNSTWIAGELQSGKLGLWNLKERREVVIEIPSHKVYSYDFSPDSTQVLVRFAANGASACCGSQNGVQVWSLESGRPISGHIPTVGSHATAYFSHNGKWLIAQSENTLSIYDAKTGQDTGRKIPRDINFKDEGDYLLGEGAKGTARLFSLSTGKEIAQTDIGADRQVDGEFSVDRGIVVLDDMGGRGELLPIIRDLRTLQSLPIKLEATGIKAGSYRIGADLSKDGNVLFSLYHLDRQFTGVFWDTRTGKQIAQIKDASPHPIYSVNGEFVAVEVEERNTREQKSTVIFNKSRTKYWNVAGRPVQFIGDALVSISEKGYHFTDIMSGQSAFLDRQSQDISIAPDGSRFFYVEHGAVRLFEIKRGTR